MALSRRARVALPIVIAILCVALFELGASVVYSVQNGGIIYFRTPAPPTDAPIELGQRDLLHPVFGFIRRPGITPDDYLTDERQEQMTRGDDAAYQAWLSVPANNYGFTDPADFPVARRDENEILVGIFGGSVAHYFALQGGDTLATQLAELDLGKKEDIRVLNFAQSGYKQPQQIFVLNYFAALGQEFDYIINLDGFNEVALAEINERSKVAAAAPSVAHLRSVVVAALADQSASPEAIKEAANIIRLQEGLEHSTEIIRTTRCASRYILNRALASARSNALSQNAKDFEEQPTFWKHKAGYNFPPPLNPTDAEIVDFWAQTSIMMGDVATRMGAVYLHVLQPNQYFTERIFNEEERVIAFDSDSRYRDAVETRYPMLIAKTAEFEHAGVHLFDATKVLDTAPPIAYADTCCHYTGDGSRVLAESIAHELVKLDSPNQR